MRRAQREAEQCVTAWGSGALPSGRFLRAHDRCIAWRRGWMRIEDYALLGDTHTLALVGRNGSIDWACFPRFDSGACFAALLGTSDNGRWIIAPRDEVATRRRHYRKDTLILETEITTRGGRLRVIDCMPIRGKNPDIVRIVEGVSGTVAMRSELIVRYDYGSVLPWVRTSEGRLHIVAGPDALVLESPLRHEGKGFTSVCDFEVHAGESVPFVLTWHPSHEPVPESPDPFRSIEDTERFWREWVTQCKDEGEYRDQIVRSLIVLKALTFAPSGGIVAAGTTGLPEELRGVRNWDYRYCWLRDTTFTLYALMHGGYFAEARAFRDWLLRAVAGDLGKLQIMYGVLGERRLEERELPWLAGYESSRPVRIGNAAVGQLQLDVYGELSDTLLESYGAGMAIDESIWPLQRGLIEWLETNWSKPDEGLWEVRGVPRKFTHSKVMTWVAVDRAIKTIERHGISGPIERWRGLRAEIHRDVCENGWSERLQSFTQYYGGDTLDASLLLMPLVGFLPPSDARVSATIRAIERELKRDGFVRRYNVERAESVDGLPGHEGAFIACSFWLVDAYVLTGRHADAADLFRQLLGLANDVGLLSEEYDPERKRLLGNFPQAFSHVALVNSARNLSSRVRPAEQRGR